VYVKINAREVFDFILYFRKVQETNEPEPKEESELSTKKPKPAAVGVEAFTGRTGGAYIPPARLRAMQAKITDKSR
jgi:pre-mRNA-splicing factor CWC22